MNIENLPGEIWKDIPNYEGYYQVSNKGRVKSLVRKHNLNERILKQRLNSAGYYRINLIKNGIHKSFTIHRLMGLTFLKNPFNYPSVLHENDIRKDNQLENLYWGTTRQNSQDAIRNGKINMKGENNIKSKLTEENVREIKKLWNSGKYYQRELAEKFNIGQGGISKIILGEYWKHLV